MGHYYLAVVPERVDMGDRLAMYLFLSGVCGRVGGKVGVGRGYHI